MQTLVDLRQWLDSLPNKIDVKADDLRDAADSQVSRIRKRTDSGISYDGTPFAPYSVRSKKQGTVDLRETGSLLDSLYVEATDAQARISISDPLAAEIAGYLENGTQKMQARPFFGVSLEDRESIISDIRTSVFRRVNG